MHLQYFCSSCFRQSRYQHMDGGATLSAWASLLASSSLSGVGVYVRANICRKRRDSLRTVLGCGVECAIGGIGVWRIDHGNLAVPWC